MAVEVTLKELLESGVHFGHQTRKWNPKMREYIFIARGGIHIIDLQKTMTRIGPAFDFLTRTVASGKQVLFVATKKQARQPVREAAEAVGMPWVTERWLGGMLTNFQTISQSVQRLDEIEGRLAEGQGETLSKKEALQLTRQREKRNRNLGGIRDMKRVPGALFVVDTAEEGTAIKEANKLGIPVVGVVDTNADPDDIDYAVPGNDDAIRAIQLFCRLAKEAIIEGVAQGSEGAAAGREVEVKAEAKAKAEPKVEPKVEAKVEAKAEAKVEAKVEPEAKAEAQARRSRLPSPPRLVASSQIRGPVCKRAGRKIRPGACHALRRSEMERGPGTRALS
jgi:small subunit ribosomal protein S2